jgi:hypothetical protein
MTSTATARDNRRRRQQEADAAARAKRLRRRRRRLVGGSVAGVLVAVAAMFGVAQLTGSSGSAGSGSGSRAMADADGTAIAQMLIDTPRDLTRSIGLDAVSALPIAVNDVALTSNGKPEILYLGADYCPFCAAQRWPLVLALSRFGTWTHVGLTASALDDVYPGTATFSFHDAAYRSDYVTFIGRELYTNVRVGGHYRTLDKPTDAEAALLARYGRSFPLIDFGGRYVQDKASYLPSVLHGMSADDIAMAVANPRSPVAKAIAGSANALTAAICGATGGEPTAVCNDPAVVAATAKIHG